MTDMNSPDYYRGRERQARDLADLASFPEIAKIHRTMAAEYSRLALEAERLEAPATRHAAKFT